MDEMLMKISEYPNGTVLRISWENGNAIIECVIDTIYETDNGMDDDEDGYQEFYACLVYIKKILNNSMNKIFNVDGLTEISQIDEPTSIELENGTVIWKKK